MKMTLRKTALAVATTALVASPAVFAQEDDWNESVEIVHDHTVFENRHFVTTDVDDIDITVDDIRNFETNTTTRDVDVDVTDVDITVDDTRNFETNTITRNYDENVTVDADVNATVDADVDLFLDAGATVRYNGEFNEISNDRDDSWTTTESHDYTRTSDIDTTESHAYTSTWDVTANEDVDIDSDIRREQNEHGRSVYLSKDLSLSSDIEFTGAPTISGDIGIDSAAIAVVDGRQAIGNNSGENELLENTAGAGGDSGSGAAGNMGFNMAAGDNNAQDNAAALSAADASFAFGMADAEIFNSQVGGSNVTSNSGVANAATMDGNAFNAASGNLSVNVAAGNNNAQRNSLAASVATSAYAQASVASDQVSSGNATNNAGYFETEIGTLQYSLTGSVSGTEGSSATYGEGLESLGAAYQMGNIYPETWGAENNDGNHEDSPRLGHIDMDGDMQGSIDNPYRGEDEFGEIGGIAFDLELPDLDLSDTELAAALSGTAEYAYQVAVYATNDATMDGAAFSGASGNIGVNIASGTGNLQSNSLSMAVAQPSTGGNGGGNGGGGGG